MLTHDQAKVMFEMILGLMENCSHKVTPEQKALLVILAAEYPEAAYEFRYLRDELEIDVINFTLPLSKSEAFTMLAAIKNMGDEPSYYGSAVAQLIRKTLKKFPEFKDQFRDWLNLIGIADDKA